MRFVLKIFGVKVIEIETGKDCNMSLQTMKSRVTANGAVILAAIGLGIGVKTPPPPPPPNDGGATAAELDALEADLAAQDALLQKAIDDAKAGNGGTVDPAPPPIPGAAKVISLDPNNAQAGVNVSVTIKGTGLTGAVAVATGGLALTNSTVVDDQTMTVDVTGASAGQQFLGVNGSELLFTVV